MSVESADDRLSMLEDFGLSATWTPVGGTATTVIGIFDNEFLGVGVGAGAQAATDQPRFLCRTSDVPAVADGDALTVDSVAYIIRVPMPDGTGMTELVLEEQ